MAKAQQNYSHLVQELQRAEMLASRLGGLLNQKTSEALGCSSVAQLRERRVLTEKLAVEGDKLRQRVEKLREDSLSAGTELAQVEYRKRSYDKAAAQAKRAEFAAKEDAREAATPARLRR